MVFDQVARFSVLDFCATRHDGGGHGVVDFSGIGHRDAVKLVCQALLEYLVNP